MLINHIECNNLYLTLLVHKHIQRNHFNYYTCQTSVYCTICCLLIVKQWQKCQNSIHHSQDKKKQTSLLHNLQVWLCYTGEYGEYFDSHFITVIVVFFLFLFVYCYGKMQFFIHCNFFCQEYKFTYLLTYTAKCISCFMHLMT